MLTERERAQRRNAGEARRQQVIAQVGQENVSAYYSDLGGRGGRPAWQATVQKWEEDRKRRNRYAPRRNNLAELPEQAGNTEGESRVLPSATGTDNTQGAGYLCDLTPRR